MGTGRWLIACVVFAAACAGKSISRNPSDGSPTDAGDEPPTGAACKTSFACPTGERCDDGNCVPDDGCPHAREPELLFEAAAGSPWAAGWNPYLTVLDGREYLTLSDLDESGSLSGVTRFLELQTGRELLFVHEPGSAGCFGSPARCMFSSGSAPAIAEIELGTDTVSIREETLFAFSGYDLLFSSDADYRDGRVVVTAGTLVELWELGEPAPIASIDLAEKSLLNVLVDNDGRSERVVSWVQENQITGEGSEVAVTALETGASSTLIYRGPGGYQFAPIPMPDGDDWFVLIDGEADEPAVSVYRTRGAVALVGTHDNPWALGVDSEYRSGERPLEPGPSAYVRHCDENGCGSYRFWLSPPILEAVGSVALPEPGFRGSYARAIACGGADFWLVTKAGDDAPTRYWSIRIPGRAGFP